MKLSQEQRQELLRERGIWVTEACDRCRQLLGSVRYTFRGQKGEWCSELCRDGEESKIPVLSRLRRIIEGQAQRDAKWCNTCRKRPAYQSGLTAANYPGIAAHSKEVTDRVRGLPYSPFNGCL